MMNSENAPLEIEEVDMIVKKVTKPFLYTIKNELTIHRINEQLKMIFGDNYLYYKDIDGVKQIGIFDKVIQHPDHPNTLFVSYIKIVNKPIQ